MSPLALVVDSSIIRRIADGNERVVEPWEVIYPLPRLGKID